MKLKTYFMTLLLFLLFFNGSIFLVSLVNLNSSMNNLRQCCLGEHYFISTTYVKDLSAIESRGGISEDALKPLFQSYVSYFGKKAVALQVSKDGKLLYSSSNLPQITKSFPTGSRILTTVDLNKRKFIYISGKLPVPYNNYTLTYFYDLSDNISAWNRVTKLLYSVGIGISSLLALCLILLLNHIFKPLKQISLASQKLANGEYENRLPVNGKDEISEMAQNFNHMADEIQNQITKLANSSEQKQCFIDNFAHELRTPLTTIYGYAEYIQKASITEEEKLSATEYIMSESLRLQNMAYSLLDLAMLRNDEIKFADISVSELLEGTLEEMLQKSSEKQLKLEYSHKFDFIQGDRELLKCLLVNLTENAIKACNPGGYVKLEAYLEDFKKVLTVKDNGRGMTEEQMNHITEAFYRVDKSRSRSEGGVGLGLSLCEQIASRHDATLSFSSQPGLGTTAKITFTTL